MSNAIFVHFDELAHAPVVSAFSIRREHTCLQLLHRPMILYAFTTHAFAWARFVRAVTSCRVLFLFTFHRVSLLDCSTDLRRATGPEPNTRLALFDIGNPKVTNDSYPPDFPDFPPSTLLAALFPAAVPASPAVALRIDSTATDSKNRAVYSDDI